MGDVAAGTGGSRIAEIVAHRLDYIRKELLELPRIEDGLGAGPAAGAGASPRTQYQQLQPGAASSPSAAASSSSASSTVAVREPLLKHAATLLQTERGILWSVLSLLA